MPSLRSLFSAARLLAGFVSPRRRAGRSWDDALSLVRSGACAGVSVDCFDTLLARAEPDWEQHALAELVGAATGHAGQDARRMLRLATRRARRGAGDEPAAAVIWAEYCNALGIPGRLAAQLCKHELKLLEMTSTASVDALEFIAAVERLRLPWIVCSDTRWSRAELSWLLSLKGFCVAGEAVFASCDYGQSKFRGGLYAIAQEHLRTTLEPRESRADIVHVGDNFLADCCSAACHGWHAIVIPPQRQIGARVAAAVSSHLEAVRQEVAESLR